MTYDMLAEFFIEDEDLIQTTTDLAEVISEITLEVDNFRKG